HQAHEFLLISPTKFADLIVRFTLSVSYLVSKFFIFPVIQTLMRQPLASAQISNSQENPWLCVAFSMERALSLVRRESEQTGKRYFMVSLKLSYPLKMNSGCWRVEC